MIPVARLRVGLVGAAGERPVGELVLADRRIFFSFDSAFLADPLPLSPLRLPIQPGLIEEPRRVFEGLFGVFDDSLPDGWGRLLLDREVARRGGDRLRLTPLDRLAAVGTDGPGALVYRPAQERDAPAGEIDLHRLAAEAQQVMEGEPAAILPELLALGGSSGGARPKVLLGWSPEAGTLRAGSGARGLPVIVKFHMRRDPPDTGAVEESYARMARLAGLHMMPTWLLSPASGHPGFFATQRFDRPPARRDHVHTLCGLLHADHRTPCLDYHDLLRTIRWLTREQAAVEEGYRRMVFNVLTMNRDDHSRNTAFQMDRAGTWRLAPAYDLTPSTGPGGEHWMTVDGEGRDPGRAHLAAVARRAGIARPRALEIQEEVWEAVDRWPQIARDSGVSGATIAELAPRLSRRLV